MRSEFPAFGSVWSWDGGAPLMAIVPLGPSFAGARVLFMHLDDGSVVTLFWAAINAEDSHLPEWKQVDD